MALEKPQPVVLPEDTLGTLEHAEAIIRFANNISPDHAALPENTRLALMTALEKLKMTFQTPVEATTELFEGPAKLSMVKLAIDLRVFDVLAQEQKIELTTLAATRGADLKLIYRVMRFLGAMGLVTEIDSNRWAPKPLAKAYVSGSPLADGVTFFQSVGLTSLHLPEYLRKTDYQEPQNAFEGPSQYAHGTKLHHFQWLIEHPTLHSAFNRFMAITRMNSPQQWYEFFPIEKLAHGDSIRPLLVDVGGGRGHDLIAFDQYAKHIPGKLYLQDLPSVIAEAQEKPERIEMLGYDFFTPQPVRNAKAYYMRTVLHDWPDDFCLKILKNIREAMGPDSLLLINENVVPNRGASIFQTWVDHVMMCNFSAKDRTQGEWLSLLQRGGFEIIKVWEPPVMTMGAGLLFETRAKQQTGELIVQSKI